MIPLDIETQQSLTDVRDIETRGKIRAKMTGIGQQLDRDWDRWEFAHLTMVDFLDALMVNGEIESFEPSYPPPEPTYLSYSVVFKSLKALAGRCTVFKLERGAR